MIDPIKPQSTPGLLRTETVIKGNETADNSFEKTLKNLISHVDMQIKESDRKAEEFAVGKNYDLHEVMIAAEKADISFQFLVQIRNKLLDAYQEIMRMNF